MCAKPSGSPPSAREQAARVAVRGVVHAPGGLDVPVRAEVGRAARTRFAQVAELEQHRRGRGVELVAARGEQPAGAWLVLGYPDGPCLDSSGLVCGGDRVELVGELGEVLD